MGAELTPGQLGWLEYVDGGQRSGFDCMFSGRTHRKSVAEGLVAKGLLSHLDAVQCDGDGGLRCGVERYATGYELTEDGIAALEASRAANASEPTDGEPTCPSQDCMMCNGEACNKCGAGCWSKVTDCTHDSQERHAASEPTDGEPEQAAPEKTK